MTLDGLVWLGFAAVTAAYVFLAIRGIRREGESAATAFFGIAGAILVFFIRQRIEGGSARGAALGATLLTAAMLVVSRGQPHLIFDPEEFSDPDTLGDDSRSAYERRRKIVTRNQVALIAFVIIGVVVYTAAGWRWLD